MVFHTTGVDGYMPEITLKVGSKSLTGFFDTGNPGTLQITPDLKDRLEREGYLTTEQANWSNGVPDPYIRANLKGLSYNGTLLTDVYNLRLTIGKENRLGMGYQFLKNYISSWNYQAQTITLVCHRLSAQGCQPPGSDLALSLSKKIHYFVNLR